MTIHRITSAILAGAIALLGATGISPAPAHADQPKRACIYVGHFAGFMHNGDDLLATPFDWDNTIQDRRCFTRSGIRYERMTANTKAERAELVRMAKEDGKVRYPIAVCAREGDPGASYALDLAYFYWAFVKHINHAERTRYADWVRAHAASHSCRLFTGGKA